MMPGLLVIKSVDLSKKPMLLPEREVPNRHWLTRTTHALISCARRLGGEACRLQAMRTTPFDGQPLTLSSMSSRILG